MSRRDLRFQVVTSSFADSVGARRLTPARAVPQERRTEGSVLLSPR
jgi:hypothetical protein